MEINTRQRCLACGCLVSDKGKKHYQQDRKVLIGSLAIDSPELKTVGVDISFFAVYDGHGGNASSRSSVRMHQSFARTSSCRSLEISLMCAVALMQCSHSFLSEKLHTILSECLLSQAKKDERAVVDESKRAATIKSAIVSAFRDADTLLLSTLGASVMVDNDCLFELPLLLILFFFAGRW